MTIEQMKQRKAALGYTSEMISQLSGVPLSTVQKIFSGATRSPRYNTLKALEAVLKEEDIPKKSAESDSEYEPEAGYTGLPSCGIPSLFCEEGAGYKAAPSYEKNSGAQSGLFCESAFKYDVAGEELDEPDIFADKSGRFTIEDYYALPDDQRVELIDGVFYYMEAPTNMHQLISLKLASLLMDFVIRNNGKCIATISPVDVQLDKDDKTMVQPDVLVVCDRSKMKKRVVYGAPDLVIEVLSKSTRKKDMITKLSKYCFAGVREYWLIDPDKKSITVYIMEGEFECRVYEKDDPVPVWIFSGECVIDFKEIFEYVSFLEDVGEE